MYVCLCKNITDKQIRSAAAKGVANLYELRDCLGVATGCGGCADMAENILQESRDIQSRAEIQFYVPTPA